MRRHVLVLPAIAALFLWPATPRGQRLPSLSADLAQHPVGAHLHHVIVQAEDASLPSLRLQHRLGLRRELSGALALDVTDAELQAMSHDPGITHISGDLPILASMAVTNKVTGADSLWQGSPGLLGIGGTPGNTGGNVGVAVVDSGIAAHRALGARVIAHVNLVSSEPGVTGDPFGHGTHVAGIIGGAGGAASGVTPAYSGGSAPSVRLVDVRVLGRNGSGLTSDVIAGIDWAVANRARYNIRVINLSLGHPVTEPAATDPLCQAVARAVSASVLVVTAAGNYGLTASGAPVLGGVTSPGNSPFALTVGAIDTAGTVDPSDDTVAPYSSRGPTRYDLTVKPDVVAPGTRIVSLEVPGSYISTTYPNWHIAGTGTNAYLRLTGTSMAAAVVSGGAALLINAQPGLAPAQVKLAMQMGARFMPNGGLIAAGAGNVYFPEAAQLSKSGLLPNLLNTLSGLLGESTGASFRDSGTLINRVYDRSGLHLLGLLDAVFLWQNADSAEWGVLQLLGLNNPLSSVPSNQLVWGDVAGWSNSYYVVWGSSIQSPSGEYVVWGSGDMTDGSYVVWGSALPGGH